MTSEHFDDSALRQPVDQAAARAEGETAVVGEGRVGERRGTVAWAVFQSIVLIGGFGILGSLLVMVVQSLFGGEAGPSTFIIGGLMVLPLAVSRVRGVRDGLFGDNWVTQYRLRRFAAANGLTYVSLESEPARVASMMRRYGGVSSDVISGDRPRSFLVGVYSYDTGTARFRMPRTATYLHVPLRAPLPAFTLASRAVAAVAVPAGGVEPIEVDGPLAGRFSVHAAPADEPAVRALLAGTALERLASFARHGAVEIIDDAIIFLIPRETRVDAPELWEWVGDAIDLVDELEKPGTSAAAPDEQRLARREALLAPPKGGRPFLMGCVLPVLAGLVLAAVIAALSR